MVKANPSFHTLQNYEGYLKGGYKDDLIEIYQKAIKVYLKDHTGRKYYRESCRMLRRMKKLGATSQVKELIEAFKVSAAKGSVGRA